MSRNIDSTYKNAIGAPVVYPAFFFEMDFASGFLRLWTGNGSKSWDSKTWTGGGSALTVDSWSEETSLAARLLSIGLNGLDAAIIALALNDTPYQGRTANVYLNIMSDAGASSTVDSSYLVIEGKMDQLNWSDAGQDGVSMSLSIEDRLNDLFRPREVRYTDQDQRALFPTDKGLEYVAALQTKAVVGDSGSQNATIGGNGAATGGGRMAGGYGGRGRTHNIP